MNIIRKQQGFTIIELSVVIVVLIILVLSAAPAFLDATPDAQSATNENIASSFKSSIKNVKVLWRMQGSPAATNNNNGAQVALNNTTTVVIDDNYGYPVGSRGSDRVNNFNVRDCQEVFDGVVEHSLLTARRGQVNNTTYADYDIIITRENGTPDICHYTWSYSIESRPANNAPSAGSGFSYNPIEGNVTTFDFTSV